MSDHGRDPHPPPDAYLVLASRTRAEIKVKGSRFIAYAVPAWTEDEAADEIRALRAEWYDATHHCSAYRIGPEADLFRHNDDGEPAGTAGLPILRQLEGRSLTCALVVVVRYFGGTKLGTGGLIRAYGDAAAEALNAGRIEERLVTSTLHLRFAYGDTSPAMHVIQRFQGDVVLSEYADDTRLVVDVRRSRKDAFIEAYVDGLGGRGEIEETVAGDAERP